jgi:hypothetical protein
MIIADSVRYFFCILGAYHVVVGFAHESEKNHKITRGGGMLFLVISCDKGHICYREQIAEELGYKTPPAVHKLLKQGE